MKLILSTMLVFLLGGQSYGLSLLDETADLEGKYIVKVGDLRKLMCPPYGQYDCLTWPNSFYQLSFDICMEVGGFYSGCGTDTGILAKDEYGAVSLFVVAGIAASSMKQFPVTLYQCPSV